MKEEKSSQCSNGQSRLNHGFVQRACSWYAHDKDVEMARQRSSASAFSVRFAASKQFEGVMILTASSNTGENLNHGHFSYDFCQAYRLLPTVPVNSWHRTPQAQIYSQRQHLLFRSHDTSRLTAQIPQRWYDLHKDTVSPFQYTNIPVNSRLQPKSSPPNSGGKTRTI